jgi:hypothetical protein
LSKEVITEVFFYILKILGKASKNELHFTARRSPAKVLNPWQKIWSNSGKKSGQIQVKNLAKFRQ